MKDVLIIGGGPSGCFLGEKLAEKGLDVTILEGDSQIGHPACCAGILGVEGLKEIGLNPKDWAINSLEEGVFHFPNDEKVSLYRDKTEAYVIDRAGFDQDLAERAARAGAEILPDTKCEGISRKNKSVKVKTEGKEEILEGRMIVGADGTNSTVARNLGLMKEFSPIVCAQAEIVREKETKKAEVFLDKNLSENFFGWIVPSGETFKVGIGDTKGNIKKKLFKFMKNKSNILPENPRKKITNLTTDLIPKSRTRKIYGEKTILVGDAGGEVKPLTGGGIYLGLSCANIAAETISKALKNKPSEENLSRYKDDVENKFGKEFELGARGNKVFRKMSNEDLNEFSELLQKTEIKNMILENADFDHHSKLFNATIKEGPRLIKTIGARKISKYLGWLIS